MTTMKTRYYLMLCLDYRGREIARRIMSHAERMASCPTWVTAYEIEDYNGPL